MCLFFIFCTLSTGMNCLTEMYSAIEAEVPVSTDPTTTRNYELLKKFKNPKRLIVCGQAISHCVRWTVRDICEDWKAQGDADFSKMYFCKDGTSPVYGYDYTVKELGDELIALNVNVVDCKDAFIGL